MKEVEKLQVHYVPVDKLLPAAYNPRKWDELALDQLMESIEKFGMQDALIINMATGRENIVVGGHMRLEALKRLGWTEAPCVFVDILDETLERELNLRLNKNTGQWDLEKLKDFDISLLLDVGFGEQELSSMWDGMLEVENDGFDIEKELKKAIETKIKPGDLFQLGQHRIICGDSQDLDILTTLVGKEKIAMLYTDPVYNISLDYGKGIGGNRNYGGEAINDSKTLAEYESFLSTCIGNVLEICKSNIHFFVWCDEVYVGLIQQIYGYLNIQSKRICLWIKDNQNPTPKVAFNKVTEYCIYGTIGHPYLNDSIKNFNEILNKELGTGNRLHDDILDLLNIWLTKRLAGSDYNHPTEKPPTLHEKALRRCSKPGDVILDIFSGSGSIMVACEQLKRRAFMCDITPAFVQLTINRYEQLSGKKAIKLN